MINSDPLFSVQSWVFDLINVEPVWEQGYRGNGIRVRVNDDGVDANHPEFAGRFDVSGSCSDYLPSESVNDNFHGTAVASILGGGADNGECALGVAPEVTISSCYALRDSGAILAEKLDSFDISQNSFGADACRPEDRRKIQECPFQYNDPGLISPCSACDFSSSEPKSSQCESAVINHCSYNYENDIRGCIEFLDLFIEDGRCEYNTLSNSQREAITTGITQGRNGKGIIYVWASGNTFEQGEDANFQGFLNTRFTIAVGAVDQNGYHASYSTPGAALFVSGPGGDHEFELNHITANVGSGCHEAGMGTSFACPVVSGVIALMLEANPNLGWRDVQGILASTSRMVKDDPYDDSRVTNAGGFTHSNFYGFGIVDANAAVDAAKSWELYGSEEMMIGESELLNIPIADDPSSPTISSIMLDPQTSADFVAESVVVYLNIKHFSRGDLDVVLTSPQGTESVLHPGNRPENTQLDDGEQWKLLTVRSWGELARGKWTISLKDISGGDVSSCADYPFLPEFQGSNSPFYIDCGAAESERFYCIDGQLRDDAPEEFIEVEYEGRTADEACCACGGGLSTDDFVDQMVRWRIVVSGQKFDPLPTANPMPSPNHGPSAAPDPFGGLFQSSANHIRRSFLYLFGVSVALALVR
jgi:hypothetical protein